MWLWTVVRMLLSGTNVPYHLVFGRSPIFASSSCFLPCEARNGPDAWSYGPW
jgi:hypothetical protein